MGQPVDSIAARRTTQVPGMLSQLVSRAGALPCSADWNMSFHHISLNQCGVTGLSATRHAVFQFEVSHLWILNEIHVGSVVL